MIGFAKKVGFLMLLSFSSLLPMQLQAEGFQYEEGTHFVELEVPVKTRNPAVVEVTEYFSYGCPHCFRFEPLIQQWKQELSEDVVFNRTPAIWQVTGYELYARTYYTAQAMGVLEKVHGLLFQAIHDQRRRLLDLESMAEFMAEQGVDAEQFVKIFADSFGVKAMYQQAVARQRIYRSGGVPAIIINGKYRVEASMVGNSNAGMLQVTNFLIDRERRMIQAAEPVPVTDSFK
jgi:thiol:disulfide interchange protein DsbA